jgi:ribulose-phosphate 3-epimerase
VPRRAILITPSILSANLAYLQEEIESIAPYADWLQVDVMDGHFVPNLSFGAPVLRHVRSVLPIDVHLMVSNPAARVKEFLAVGAKNITFHAEAVKTTRERKALIRAIHKGKATAGIALNPNTPLSAVQDVLPDVDLLLIMSVQPGFGGQKFISRVLKKVQQAHERFPMLMIQMDGGIDARTAKLCLKAGATNFVSGSYIFSAKNRAEAITSLRGT